MKQSQGESLETQEASIQRFAAERGWQIVPKGEVWKTVISGRKTDRSDYEEIIEFIKANPGFVHYYLFKAIDRFTRAGTQEYERMRDELAHYGVETIDLNGIIQPSKNTLEEYGVEYPWSRHRPSEITENVMATNAKQEVTTILTRMIGQEIRLTRDGYRMRCPPDGFINTKEFVDGKKRPIQSPDPDRAKYITAMFDYRARGGLNDKEIVDKVNAMGYKSPIRNRWNKEHSKIIGHSGNIPLTVKQLQRIIQNPAYPGFICERWTDYKLVKTKYPGLVSIETYNLANKGKLVIKPLGNNTFELVEGSRGGLIRLRNNPLFPYKFIRCHLCEKPFLGSSPRGKSGQKFPTYHCARKHKHYGVPKKVFDESVERFISGLQFQPEILNALEATLVNKYREREREVTKASGDIHQNIADLKVEQAGKLEAIVASKSPTVREILEKDIEELETRIKAAKKERMTIEISENDIKAFIREAKKIVAHPAEILLNPVNMDSQRNLFTLVFEEIPTYQQILNGTPKLTWIFKLSSENTSNENQLVALPGVEPGLLA